MADAKLTALTAASALAAADLFYVSQSAASRKATGTQLLALVGTTYVPLTGGTMTGALTLTAGAVGTPSLMFTGAGATTGLYSTGANDISFAVNGSRRAYFSTSSFTSLGTIVGSGGLTVTNGNCGVVSASGGITWGTSGSADTYIYRDAAATLALRNGTTQQIFRLYNSYTDSSNFERLTLTGVAGTSVNITAETLGTGGDNLNLVLGAAGASGLISFKIDGSQYHLMGSGYFLQSGYHQLAEMTAPAAGAANTVRIYAEDNGAGKTRLMALFATGSAVQLGIEP